MKVKAIHSRTGNNSVAFMFHSLFLDRMRSVRLLQRFSLFCAGIVL